MRWDSVYRMENIPALLVSLGATANCSTSDAYLELSATQFLVEKDDKINNKEGSRMANIPLTVVLDNLRSAFNVGSIFRTGECGERKKPVCTL
jgi:hypothetical protein